MHYLTESSAIRNLISQLTTASTLWLDTEIADWWTRNKKLSLIQVSADANDPTGDSVYLLDVLNKPDVVAEFRQKIIANPQIEKVFHNAAFDLRFLGKDCAQNVTCTLKIARQLPLEKLGTPNRKLKTLAATWGNFDEIDTESQSSDWGQRPLHPQQLQYAKMDVVYLACVHRHLLNLTQPQNFAPLIPRNSQSSPSFSVTKVRVAFECPRLFYLGHHRGGMMMFVPPGEVSGIGNEFHKWADKFVQLAHTDARFQALFRPSFADLEIKDIAQQMQQLFYQRAFYPYLETISPDKAPILLQTWQGLTHLIERWAELLVKNRRYCQAEDVIPFTLINLKPDVEFSFTLPDNSQQQVRGKFDSLVYDFEQHRLCVVEYKTYVSPDKSAQLAQVALYSYMLRERLGVEIDSAVCSVLPSWEELTFSWDELESTVHQLIPHKLQQMRDWANWEEGNPNPPPPTTQPYLCEICPQQHLCQTLFTKNPWSKAPSL